MAFQEIESLTKFEELLQHQNYFERKVFENIDFTKIDIDHCQFYDCIFMGCTIDHIDKDRFKNCSLFPHLKVGYNPYISSLYNRHTLFDNYIVGQPETYHNTTDYHIYKTFVEKIELPRMPQHGEDAIVASYEEVLARRMHDNAVTNALFDFLSKYQPKKVVAIMGGHKVARTDAMYRKVAFISKALTEKGYLMVSGGGPGTMEATHLGAWLADPQDVKGKKIDEAIKILSAAPVYHDFKWLDKAFEVLELHPTSKYESLGIPTWFYGHEPPTPFASHIAKYFANSVREDGLLAIANGGIIYAPGSAGTLQEIFQDIAQNHYRSYGLASPMVFLDRKYWLETIPVYPLIQSLSQQKILQNIELSIHDEPQNVINDIVDFNDQKS